MNDYISLKYSNKLFDYHNSSAEDKQRIKVLKIPPNWTNVKLNKDYSSKIQVTGEDAKGRTQYIYHPVWNVFSKESKYVKINSLNFDKFLKVINKYSKLKFSTKIPNKVPNEVPKNYVIANMFIIMKDLNIRIGNEKYLKENDSIGLCTMSKEHLIKISPNSDQQENNGYKFEFKGKKGVLHEKYLYKNHIIFIETMLKLPGYNLFQYHENNYKNIHENNYKNIHENIKKIDAQDLNDFLKKYVDENMTSKDIRTYCANQIFKKYFQKFIKEGLKENKARIEATKITAKELGNTPKVCRDSYIDPDNYVYNFDSSK
jgi:DNA topoisomerase-1